MRKLTSGMTVPDMAPDVVYLTQHTGDVSFNQTYSRKSMKPANHHLDYAEDLYQKEMQERIENEDYVAHNRKFKPVSPTTNYGEEMNNIRQSKEKIEEYLRQLGNQGKEGAELLRKLKEVFENDVNSSKVNETSENSNQLYIKMIENAMTNDDSSWRAPRLRHYQNRFKRSTLVDQAERESLSDELFKHDQRNNAAIEEVSFLIYLPTYLLYLYLPTYLLYIYLPT